MGDSIQDDIKQEWKDQLKDFGALLRQRRAWLNRTQPQMAALIGVNQTTISRIEAGKLVPRRPLAEAIADAYHLNVNERAELFYIVLGSTPTYTVSEVDIYFAWQNIRSLYNTRIGTQFHSAIESGQNLIAWIDAKVIGVSGYASNELHRAKARALFERIQCFTAIYSSTDLWNNSFPLVNKIKEIAKKLNDKEIAGLACWIYGDLCYHQQNWRGAIQSYERAFPKITSIPEQLELWRTKAICLARLGRSTELRAADEQIHGLIADNQFPAKDLEHVLTTYEGLSRARLGLECSDPMSTLERADGVYTKMEEGKIIAPHRRIQLLRSKIEVVAKQAPKDVGLIEHLGRQALELTKLVQHKKYEDIISNLLNRVLNR